MSYGPWEYALEHPSYLRKVCREYKDLVKKKAGVACAHINPWDGSCTKHDKYCHLPADAGGIGCGEWEVASLQVFTFNANIQTEEEANNNQNAHS